MPPPRHIPGWQRRQQPSRSPAQPDTHFLPQSTISRPPVQWLITMDTVTNVEFSVREYIKVKNLLIESAY